MKWIHSLVLGVVLSLFLGVPPSLAEKGSVREKLVQSNARLALGLYQQVKSKGENLFFSPYSLSIVLAMLFEGARGRTAGQFVEALGWTNRKKVHGFYDDLRSEIQLSLKGQFGYKFHLASALWAREGLSFEESFVQKIRRYYEAGFHTFKGKKPASSINAWVSRQTQGKITKAFPAGPLERQSRLLFLSAAYFKCGWFAPFPRYQTKKKRFFVDERRYVEIPMMHKTGTFRYLALPDKTQILALPYHLDQVWMVVFLPATREGLPLLEKKLKAANFLHRMRSLSRAPKRKVEVAFPRFALKQSHDLVAALKAVGLPYLFSQERANFRGIAQEKLFVAGAQHSAYINVNEKGTESAALTALTVKSPAKKKATQKVIAFRADRPFLFALYHPSTSMILFLGRLTRFPQAKVAALPPKGKLKKYTPFILVGTALFLLMLASLVFLFRVYKKQTAQPQTEPPSQDFPPADFPPEGEPPADNPFLQAAASPQEGAPPQGDAPHTLSLPSEEEEPSSQTPPSSTEASSSDDPTHRS